MDMRDLGANVEALRDKLAKNLSAGGISVEDGETISEMIEKASGLISPQGKREEFRVAAASTVYAGDHVKASRELDTAAELRIAPYSRMLDIASLPDGRVVMLFLQNDDVKIKAARYVNGQIQLGATAVLEEASASSKLGVCDESKVAVIYRGEGFGFAQVVSYDGLVPTLGEPDVWMSDEPYNITCERVSSQPGYVAVTYTQKDSPRAHFAILSCRSENIFIATSTEFAEDADKDEFAAAWSMSEMADGRFVVTWFTANDKPVRFAIINCHHESLVATVDFDSACIYQGSISRTNATAMGKGILFANAIARVANGLAVKTFLSLEYWNTADTAYGAHNVWYGKVGEFVFGDAERISTCVKAVTVGQEAIVLWRVGSALYSAVLHPDDGTSSLSPATPIGTIDGDAIPTVAGNCVAVCREKDGGVWLTIYKIRDVVSPSDGAAAIGTALRSARSGEAVLVALS